MPSTYTDNGGIELPANGEQSAVWGDTVNVNMNIIDRLTNGVGSISLSGTTHTLTVTDGAVSQGQFKVLVLGGSPSGTNTITINPNTGQHLYVVKNASGQTATFTQGSGSNVSVLNGTSKIICSDGAGGAAAVTDLTAAVDLAALIINGVTVTSSAAELNKMTGVTADAADLNLVDGSVAGSIVNNKAVVYSGAGQVNATTLAIAGAAITSSAVELNKLTGVTATSSEINNTASSTSNIQTQLNTKALAANPSLSGNITITGGTQSWVVNASGDELIFAYNGTSVMKVDGSGNITAIGDVTAFGSI